MSSGDPHRGPMASPLLRAPAAVLFDIDGTLLDSEALWEVALHELAARYGATLTPAVRRQMVGTSSATTMDLLLDHIGQLWRDPDEGAAWLDQRVRDLYAQGPVWRPGARDLVDSVRAAGVPTALVTNTSRTLVDVALATLGPHRFDVVVCGDEVDLAKPHPQPYLTAAALLGVRPQECVAVEDSPTGIASAAAAGCVVLAVPHEVELSHVDGTVVASLGEMSIWPCSPRWSAPRCSRAIWPDPVPAEAPERAGDAGGAPALR